MGEKGVTGITLSLLHACGIGIIEAEMLYRFQASAESMETI